MTEPGWNWGLIAALLFCAAFWLGVYLLAR
jgi:hypothetical protein